MFLKFESVRRRKKLQEHTSRPRRLKAIESLKIFLIAVCKCDSCEQEFHVTDHVKQKALRTYHFCSRKCKNLAQQSGGALALKQETTCLKRHGVRHGFLIPDVLKRTLESSHSQLAENKRSLSLKEFHVNRPTNWTSPGNTLEACVKRHQTMKRNGTYRKSSVEDALYEHLCVQWNIENVIRNVFVNQRWPIDFYIKSIDTYVQLDGIYWHGLDRPIEEIMKFRTKRDVQIYKKWLTDREQDRWFNEHGLKLVRLTDSQFLKGIRP